MDDTKVRTVRLPALTTELETAELLEWLVAEGDDVREGDPLAEVTTDKVEMELPSPYSGTVVALLEEAGAVLELGAEMVRIATTDAEGFDLGLDDEPAVEQEQEAAVEQDQPAAVEQDQPAAVEQDHEPPTEPAERSTASAAMGKDDAEPQRVPAPPGVRARATELDVDLADVVPTGRRGQVTPADLDRAVEQRAAPAARPRTQPPPRPVATGSRDERRRASVRAATARSTSRSQTIPQFTLFRRADVTERNTRRGKVSWTAIIAQAMAAALWRHPEINASWDEETETVVPRQGVRIGLAVDTPTGLMVTTMDDPDRLRPTEADALLREAAERARTGKMRPEEMQGASSTVSNLGGFGIERFTALLLPPQATILSVGAVAKQALVRDDEVVPRLCVELGLTVDHRVADGADGARFLATLVELLESR